MARRRGNNEGTISKRKDGRWCAAITTGYDDEGRQNRQFYYGKTRQEVADKLNQAVHRLSTGTYVEPNKITVGQWVDTWLNEYKKPSVRPTTYESYEYLTRVHIIPSIGHITLKDLRPEQLQKLYNDKLCKGRTDNSGGLSARTVRYIHIIIHEALSQAVKNNLIVRNVSELTTLPKQSKKEMRVLTLEEQSRFLDTLEDDRLRAAYILALATGIREGELMALRWQDVDLKEGLIKINRSIKRVKNFDRNTTVKTKLIFQEPKTNAGKRTIPLPFSVIGELEAHKKRQLLEKMEARKVYTDNDLVFCNEIGNPTEPATIAQKFYKLIKKAGIDKANFHALRHTYATRLLEANEHPKVVQEILGHSDISMTLNTYSHVMPEIKKAAAQKIDFLFQGKKKTQSSEKIE